MRLTFTSARILRALLENDAAPRYGLELMTELDILSGVMYPLLQRIEAAGVVTSWQEPANECGFPPARRYYQFTPSGREYARVTLQALSDQLRPPAVPSVELQEN